MIRKLRWKFIMINMVLVATVLIIVFSVICVMSYQQQASQSMGALRMANNREMGLPPERFRIGNEKMPEKPAGGLLPVFSVSLAEDGSIHTFDLGNVEASEELVAQAVEQALATGKTEGTLPDVNLRFLIEQKPSGTRIAFLDMSVERTYITRLVMTLALVGIGGIAAFFFISLFLAGWALRPVERAWAQQQQFVADASHELKTPLTVILANLGILEGHGQETVASQSKWIDNTRFEATRMRKLLDAMLFLAKSDGEQVPLEQAVFSISDTAWRSVLSFEPVAYEQGLDLASDIAPDVMMVGDEQQIVQLMGVLLDNACKYAGEKGSVSFRLSKTQERVLLEVHNTGELIAPEDIEHVFERFYRTDKARARTKGGYGLGLAIAAQIVRRHGGKISVASGAEKGTTFLASLPLYRERPKAE